LNERFFPAGERVVSRSLALEHRRLHLRFLGIASRAGNAARTPRALSLHRVIAHSHHGVGDAVGFLLIFVTGFADAQLRLNKRAKSPVASRSLKLSDRVS
jgi:hypothetical protein